MFYIIFIMFFLNNQNQNSIISHKKCVELVQRFLLVVKKYALNKIENNNNFNVQSA